MLVTFLQVFFVLTLIIIVIVFVFQPKRKEKNTLPENYQDQLLAYVTFYARLDEQERKHFDERFEKFLTSVRITGVNAEVEDLDRILIGAAAIIPVFYIRDWEYINLREVLLYPGTFNTDFDQHGTERPVSGMVGTGPMQNVMILVKWELRQGFIHGASNRNTAIHEFVHLVDKMDGTLDGVPEILLERKYVPEWKLLLDTTINKIRQGHSDIDSYGGTSPVECFAVIAEYFFEKPDEFRQYHPELNHFLEKIFFRK